eukprot:s37_g14.t3
MGKACGVLCLLLAMPCFVTPRVLSPSPVNRVAGASNHSASSTSSTGAGRSLLLGLVACAACAGRRVFSRAPVARKAQGPWEDIKVTRTMAASPRAKVARKAWPWEEEDPYAKCSALKLEIGMQFSKTMLTTLNKLADSADTSSEPWHRKNRYLPLNRCCLISGDAEQVAKAPMFSSQHWEMRVALGVLKKRGMFV